MASPPRLSPARDMSEHIGRSRVAPHPPEALNTRHVHRARRAGRAGRFAAATALAAPARVLSLLSGGADSVCLLHALGRCSAQAVSRRSTCITACGPPPTRMRGSARSCARRSACGCTWNASRSGPDGNLEARARDARYAAAETVRGASASIWLRPATPPPTRSRRFSTGWRSPGRRALLGMEPLRDRIVRPLLDVGAEDTRGYCGLRRAGPGARTSPIWIARLPATACATTSSRPFVRSIPPPSATCSPPRRSCAPSGSVLERSVDEAARACGAGGQPARGGALTPRRGAAARPAPAAAPARRARVGWRRAPRWAARAWREIERLARRGGSGRSSWAAGVRVVVEYGVARFVSATSGARAGRGRARSPVPGSCRFGAWEIRCGAGRRARAARPAPSTSRCSTRGGWSPR